MAKKSKAALTPELPDTMTHESTKRSGRKFIPWQINIGGVDVFIELTPMDFLPQKGVLVLVFLPPTSDLYSFLDWQQLWFVEDGSWHARTSDNKLTDQGIIDTVRVQSAAGWCYLPMTSTRWCILKQDEVPWVEPA